jgi:hypothetical protein
MAHLVVEYRHDPPLTDEELQKRGQRLGPCLEAHGVRWVSTYLSTDRRRQVCLYDAADAEAVRESFRSAAIDFEWVWVADRFSP